jgi:FMN phosphatase YigB (HAD superfamily)
MKVFNRQSFTRKPSCVLIDLDNTLFEYDPCNLAGMEAAKELTLKLLSLSAQDFDRCFADARSELKARLGAVGSSHSRLLYFQRMVERAGFGTQPLVMLQLEQAYWRAYLDASKLFDHALDFLDDLRIAGIPAVVVTDLTAQIQLRKLIILGLDRVVDWVVTSEESGADKPAPNSFELALAKVGGVEGDIWMVGDDYRCDLVGAKSAVGAITLQKMHNGVVGAPQEHKIDAAFENFADLRHLLASLPS